MTNDSKYSNYKQCVGNNDDTLIFNNTVASIILYHVGVIYLWYYSLLWKYNLIFGIVSRLIVFMLFVVYGVVTLLFRIDKFSSDYSDYLSEVNASYVPTWDDMILIIIHIIEDINSLKNFN